MRRPPYSTLLILVASLAACATPVVERARDVLSADAYIEAPYEEVWRRFTEADAYADWYSAPCRSFGTEVGDALVWAAGERVVYRGTLERIEPGRGLRHTFQFVGFGFEESPTPVDVEVVPRGPVVLVRIRHDVTGAPRTRAIITDVGWQKSLSRLKTLLETGRPMAWPAPEESRGAQPSPSAPAIAR